MWKVQAKEQVRSKGSIAVGDGDNHVLDVVEKLLNLIKDVWYRFDLAVAAMSCSKLVYLKVAPRGPL